MQLGKFICDCKHPLPISCLHIKAAGSLLAACGVGCGAAVYAVGYLYMMDMWFDQPLGKHLR